MRNKIFIKYKMIEAILTNSKRKDKRFAIKIDNKTINFGAKKGNTFIDHADIDKLNNYVKRHSKLNEDWSKGGYLTAGWWSRYLLWNENSSPDLAGAIKNLQNQFNIKVIDKT